MTRFHQVALAALLVCATAASAADVVDQSATLNITHIAAFAQTDLAQSFQQSAANISGAGIFLQSDVGTTDTVSISLWDKLPNEVGAMQLASASGPGTQGSWFDVFWSPVSVTPDTTYYLAFSGNSTLGISGYAGNGYTRGNVFANPGFGSFPSYDYAFRTYASVSSVPEPESYAMLLAGLGVLGFVGKRRRAG